MAWLTTEWVNSGKPRVCRQAGFARLKAAAAARAVRPDPRREIRSARAGGRARRDGPPRLVPERPQPPTEARTARLQVGRESSAHPGAVYADLATVEGLRKGHPGIRETPTLRPVAGAQVEAVLPFLSPQVVAMIELQRLPGARSGELTWTPATSGCGSTARRSTRPHTTTRSARSSSAPRPGRSSNLSSSPTYRRSCSAPPR